MHYTVLVIISPYIAGLMWSLGAFIKTHVILVDFTDFGEDGTSFGILDQVIV